MKPVFISRQLMNRSFCCANGCSNKNAGVFLTQASSNFKIRSVIMKKITAFAFSICLFAGIHAQQKISPDSIRNKMQWFQYAKLGIFIHWGIYSVKGIDESWSNLPKPLLNYWGIHSRLIIRLRTKLKQC